MARFVSLALLLSLVVAPVVSAEPSGRGGPFFGGWFDAFWGTLDRFFSWIPTMSSEPRKNGAYIDPSGVTVPPAGGARVQAAPRKHGAYINPSGIRGGTQVQSIPRKHGAYIDPSAIHGGVQMYAAPRQHGAYINPSGIRVVLSTPGNPGLERRMTIR